MSGALKRTPLYECHRAAGARMVAFAGWEMPLTYSGILAEHRAVRTHAGLFDVSHMGVVEIAGENAGGVCQGLTTNDVRRLDDGQAQYSLLCNEEGGVLDDVVLYRLGASRYLLCVNAASTDADLAWIIAHAQGAVAILDRSRETALLALQGPRAVDALAPHAEADIRRLRRFGCVETRVGGVATLVARTGYTGEDGFELFLPANSAARLWDVLLEAEGPVVPAGLGARDTLRLEAGLPLHGTDMGPTVSALEAGLEAVVKLDAGSFIGRDALAAEARRGPCRRLVKLLLREPGVPRHGYKITRDGRGIGIVTSGTLSPMLGRGIALGLVDSSYAAVGTRVTVEIREREVDAEITGRPFRRQRVDELRYPEALRGGPGGRRGPTSGGAM